MKQKPLDTTSFFGRNWKMLIVIFVGFICVLVVVGLGFYVYKRSKRLSPDEEEMYKTLSLTNSGLEGIHF